MDVGISKGQYVVAVSGGVDSMVLLDLLVKKPGLKLIVAHFDHGIRSDSAEDRKLVQKQAKNYGLNFVYDEGNLGPNSSEAEAREARYKFLNRVREVSRSRAIITAHHQSDVLETAIINMIRGTGRRGMSSLGSSQDVYRPLLIFNKEGLIKYAKANNLVWREDPSNQDTKYLRNHIRHKISPKMTINQKQKLLENVTKIKGTNNKIDRQLGAYLGLQPGKDKLSRNNLIMLPHIVSREVLYAWLKNNQVQNVDRSKVDKLVVIAKTSLPSRHVDLDKGKMLQITQKELQITNR